MENKFDVLELLKTIWSEKKKIVIWGSAGLVIGIIIALSIPRTYTSVILILPENNSRQTNGSQMSALAGMMGVNLSAESGSGGVSTQLYPLIITTEPFLMDMASVNIPFEGNTIPLSDYILNEQSSPWWDYILYLPSFIFSGDDENATIQNTPKMKMRYLKGIASKLSVYEDKKTKTIKLIVSMQSPEIAKVVVDSMFVLLQDFVVDYQTKKLQENLKNSEVMFEQAKEKYHIADELYAVSLDRNQGLASNAAQVKLDRLANEKNLAYGVYRQLAEQVEINRIKLFEDTPIATVLEPATVPLTPTAPNRKLIVIVWGILGALCCISVISVKQFLKDDN